MQALHNGFVFDGTTFSSNKAVLISNELIVDIIPESEIPSSANQFDLNGNYLVPSFIDLQLYGAHGKLFSQDLSFESLQATDDYCISGGCTRFLITMATNTIEKFLKGIQVIKEFQTENKIGLLGLHIEGPYINPIKRGAHIEGCVKQPTIDEIKLLLDKSDGVLKMMTLAPEQCSDEVIQFLLDHNVLVSAGHSNATYQQATDSFNKGITAVTHLFNAMSPLQSREPGMVGAVYDHTTVNSSIVCDGVHTDFTTVRISKKIMKERLFLITDAVTETTEGEYKHVFNADRYTLPDGTLSGSALTMMQAVNNCVDKVGIPFEEALRMASLYPARVARLDDQFGKIEKGYKADLVVLSKEREVKTVFRDGEILSK
ncbi:MAG: N-acetylglucosamine-6-phosphate deacetylase [Chitinophagaceae bacterium]|nr:N-acetylglucosamine-6-phosphate deacetylase [Chitinophagaceae bacterium]